MGTVMKLVIGNKNYSSWSLRAWLLMRVKDIPFEELRIPLYQPGSRERILQYSPSGKVPVLMDGDFAVWDSLAIAEYLHERYPDRRIWPADPRVRSRARSLCAEMHSGFTALRSQMPMNLRASHPGKGHTPEVLADVARIAELWTLTLERFADEGPFLFGQFTAADAFYAPVVMRFVIYGVALPSPCRVYVDAVRTLPEMQAWQEAALAETERLPQFEPYG
jgi:glutathione S-transferase